MNAGVHAAYYTACAAAHRNGAAAHTAYMKKKKNRNRHAGNDALQNGIVSANEYTGFVQHIPVSNEDIELYKKMYGGGSFNTDDIGG